MEYQEQDIEIGWTTRKRWTGDEWITLFFILAIVGVAVKVIFG